MPDDELNQMNRRLIDVTSSLIDEMRAQGARHSAEIAALANKVEENTTIMRQYASDMRIFTEELINHKKDRENLTACIIEMREEIRTTRKIADENKDRHIELRGIDTVARESARDVDRLKTSVSTFRIIGGALWVGTIAIAGILTSWLKP